MFNNSAQQPNQNPYTFLPNSGAPYQMNYANYSYPYGYQYPPIPTNNQQTTEFHPENYMGYSYPNFTNVQPFTNSYPPLQPYPNQQQTYLPVTNYNQKTNFHKTSKYRCEGCNKSFPSFNHYQKHMKAHSVCNIDGCTYSAVPKVLEEHQLSIHKTTNIIKPKNKEKESKSGTEEGEVGGGEEEEENCKIKINKQLLELIPPKYRYVTKIGNSQEEIEKWKKERRSNYPTEENIKKKEEEKQKKRERGLPEEDEDDKNENNPKKKRKMKNESDIKIPRTTTNKDGETICGYFYRGKCKLGKRCEYKHDKGYRLCNYYVNGKCKKADHCNLIHDDAFKELLLNKKSDEAKRETIKKENKSLLAKLLAKEKRHENLIVLQCLHYIYENNFFL